MMTASPFAPNPGSPRSSSFYTKTQIDLTKSFVLSATFLTRTSAQAPLDGFAVAISADPLTFGGNGGNMGIFGYSPPQTSAMTYPVIGIRLNPYDRLRPYTDLLNRNAPIGAPSPVGSSANIGPVTSSSIAKSIKSTNNLSVVVRLVYDSDTNTLSWTITDSDMHSVSNRYTNVDLPAILDVDSGYIGVGAGAGGAIQPVFLTGMTYTQ
jgi:hypothetical protein